MKYRMYVDEVGNPDLGSSDNPNHRYLSLTGVICDLDHVKNFLHPEMEKLKQKFFHSHPDEPVIFHRKEMMNAIGAFIELKDASVREAFNEKLISLLSNCQYIVITVCIDKKTHRDTYTIWRYDPYHYCLVVLLERFVLFLKRMNAIGDVLAESRGGKEDLRLKKSFHGVWENGSDFIPADLFRKYLTSKELKVRPKSANVSGLQLADLLAHPSRSEILYENGLLGRELSAFVKRIIDILNSKYDKVGSNIFGKKFIQ